MISLARCFWGKQKQICLNKKQKKSSARPGQIVHFPLKQVAFFSHSLCAQEPWQTVHQLNSWQKLQIIVLFCWLCGVCSQFRNGYLTCDQDLTSMKIVSLFLKILAVFVAFYKHLPVLLWKKQSQHNCITDSCRSWQYWKEAVIFLLQKGIPRQQLKLSVSIFPKTYKFSNGNISLLRTLMTDKDCALVGIAKLTQCMFQTWRGELKLFFYSTCF